MLATEAEDATLARLAAVAAELRVWLLIGSLCLKAGEADGRFVNRSLLIGPDGAVRARYDKIHMFDVGAGRAARAIASSAAYRPGERGGAGEAAGLRLGMSDLLRHALSAPLPRSRPQAGAEVLAVPSAFTVPTGRAHWHVLLRARAIETGAYVLAPAQSGVHAAVQRAAALDLRPQPRGRAVGRGAGSTSARGSGSASSRSTRRRWRGRAAMVPSLGHDRAYAPPVLP